MFLDHCFGFIIYDSTNDQDSRRGFSMMQPNNAYVYYICIWYVMAVNVRIHISVRKKIWFAGAKQQLQMRSGGLRFMSRVVSQHRQSYIFNTAHLARYYVLLERLINSLASIYHISIFVFFFWKHSLAIAYISLWSECVHVSSWPYLGIMIRVDFHIREVKPTAAVKLPRCSHTNHIMSHLNPMWKPCWIPDMSSLNPI